MGGFSRFLIENARWLSAGALLTFMSGFGQTFFLSVFAGEIRGDFDLSHGEWGAIYALGTTMSAIVMVWAGGLADRFRARQLGSAILIGLICASLLMAFAPSVWILILAVFALRFSGQGMAGHLGIVVMSRWFAKSRGRAIAIASFGFSIAEVLLPLSFVILMGFFDWRALWVLIAALIALGLPLLRLALRGERSPGDLDHKSENAGLWNRHWTRGEALRHWVFWIMAPAILGLSAFGTAFLFHQVHYAEIKEITHLSFVASLPFLTCMAVISMAFFGWALDRFGATRLLPVFTLPMVFAFLCFSVAQSLPMIWLGLFFYGITGGAAATLVPAFWAEIYGTKHIGSIKAVATAVMVLGSAVGPGLTGGLIDVGLGLSAQYIGISAYFLLVTLVLWFGIRSLRQQMQLSARA